jgi:DNA-binding transcriptional LysR family regulator
MRNIRGIDIELLTTLEALLSERNVTRVAERQHLAQSTVSVRLARLRRLFDDPLLVPARGGMQVTERGRALHAPLRDLLADMQRVLGEALPFDPAAAETTWRIAASDYAQATLAPPLLARLRRLAPRTRLAIVPVVPRALDRLAEAGEIDLAFTTEEIVPDGLHRTHLYAEHYRFIARIRHPAVRGKPTLAAFCALDHIVVSPEGGGFVGATDAVLAARGLSRRVALSIPAFLPVLDLVRSSDLVAMVPARLLAGRDRGLQVLDAPLRPPGFRMAMSWHERIHRDAAHVWLRRQIAALMAESPAVTRPGRGRV